MNASSVQKPIHLLLFPDSGAALLSNDEYKLLHEFPASLWGDVIPDNGASLWAAALGVAGGSLRV